MRRPIISVLTLSYLLLDVSAALAASNVAKVNEPSRGDPKVFALMARQGIEHDALKRGSTLAKLCTIRTSTGHAAYTLYWFFHLTQAAEGVHGRSELIAISAAGHVLGVYGYDAIDKPRCADGKVYPVDDLPGDLSDQSRYVTTFAPDRLPEWLGNGGPFSPVPRYERAVLVDGVGLPQISR
jgi:hypothetical protein